MRDRRLRRRLALGLLRLVERVDPMPVDDPVLLVPSGGVYRRDSIEGDDLWLAEAQVAWWLEVGQRLREYAAHAPECRAIDDCDLRCSCGLLDVLDAVIEVVACTMGPDEDVAALLDEAGRFAARQ